MSMDSKNAYADRVTITFNQVEGMPGSQVINSYEIKVDPKSLIDLDWLTTELENIFLQPEPEPSSGTRYQRDAFVLRQTRHHTSWGADATTVQYIIETGAYILNSGGQALVGAGILALVQKLKKLGHNVVDGTPEELTDDEATRHGLRLIETHYDTTLSALTATSIGINEFGQHICSASDADGYAYTVTFAVRGGQTMLISRNRDLPPNSN
ncbi:hypothetical protein [Rhodococcus qingshengii]|uniref:hypothetical protein n=1 Tax=Rhodococcus qingshengii TaxID=334542 RepID=UPI0035FA6437